MTARHLVDDAARRSISSDLDATLFVEAGAGSGKTTELVNRIVALVATGRAQITGVAAITFTEAAAAELRVRVREALEASAASRLASPRCRLRCSDALGHIDEAPISTIHGFCRRILAAHPIEAGLPPRFEVLDEVSESVEWQRRWSAELDILADDVEMSALLSLGWVLDLHERRVEDLAKAVDRDWHLSRTDGPDLAGVLSEAESTAVRGIERIRERVATAVAERHRCTVADDRLLIRLDQLADHADRVGAARTWSEAIPLLVADAPLFSGVKTSGQKKAWGGDSESVRSLVAEAASSYDGLIQALVDLVVGALAQYFEARSHVAAADRRRRGLLTFHDLLVLARDLLRAQRGVLVDVRRRTSHLLIDEFQDTDPLQLEIARLIGSDHGGWLPGRCFFVGDPKQSIYRFRGADLAAYERAREKIAGTTTLLTSNFRSVPGIIDFVNSCFEGLLGNRFESLDAAREIGGGQQQPSEAGPASSPVCVIGGEIARGTLRRDQRRIESEDCCRAIELAVSGERWMVEDSTTGSRRPARLGDVAILVPRRTGLAELEDALDRHEIGYRVESASLIFKSQEVRDVLALARALDEPGNQPALVAALRSPAYSIGDDELVRWAGAKGHWSIEEVPEPAAVTASPRVAAALADLSRLRSRLGDLGPVGTLSHAVRERRLLQVASDRPHARESWRRIRYLVDRARVFVEASGGGLSEFADWIDSQVQGGLRSSESVVPDADEDVVRIMTVHGAKGLEFPVTILCGFGTSDEWSGEYDTILRRADGGAEVHYSMSLRTSGYEQLNVAERLLEVEEGARLLYVAATRARDYLIVCGHHVPGAKQTLGERLLEASSASGSSVRRLPGADDDAEPQRRQLPDAAPGPAALDASSAGGIDLITTLGAYEAWCAERAWSIALATRQASVRATEVASMAEAAGSSGEDGAGAGEDDAEASLDEDVVLPPPVSGRGRGRAGTQIGRAVHATLQTISFADAVSLGRAGRPDAVAGHRLQAVAEAQARAERVGGKAREVGRLAKAALTSSTVRTAFASGTARRETYVSTPVPGSGGIVVDGFVDLCFTRPDGSLVVIDYKTDSVRSIAEVSERADHHELQAAAYALALTEATGRPVAKCVLVFVSPPGEPLEHELSGDALAERIEEVRATVRALSP